MPRSKNSERDDGEDSGSEINDKLTLLTDNLNNLTELVTRVVRGQAQAQDSVSVGENRVSQGTPVRQNEQPRLYCILPGQTFSSAFTKDGCTIVHFLKTFEEECKVRRIQRNIKPSLFLLQCVEPARSLIRSLIRDWESWEEFRRELIQLFCTESDKSYANQMLSTLELREDEKYWTYMDRIRSLTYQAFSHQIISFDECGNMQFTQSPEINHRITERLLQGISDRTLKGVIISELSRNPSMRNDPDSVAKCLDEIAQQLKPVKEDNSSVNHINGNKTRREDRRPRAPIPWTYADENLPVEQPSPDRRKYYGGTKPKFQDYNRSRFKDRHSNAIQSNKPDVQRDTKVNSDKGRSKVQCYGCQGWGHFKDECPTVSRQSKNKSDYKSDSKANMVSQNVIQDSNSINTCNFNEPEMETDDLFQSLSDYFNVDSNTNTILNNDDTIVKTVHSSNLQDKGVFVNININDVNVCSLLDTGSDLCMTDYQWYIDNIGSKRMLKDTNVKLFVASKDVLPVMGYFDGNVKIGGKIYNHRFLVAQKLNCEVIIGADFLRKFGCNISLLKNIFTVDYTELPLVSSGGVLLNSIIQLPNNKCFSLKSVEVPGGSERVIPVKIRWEEKIPDVDSRQFSFKSTDYLEDIGLKVADCFVKPEQGQINVLVYNLSSESKRIKKGVHIGEMEEVEAFFHEYGRADKDEISMVNRILCDVTTDLQNPISVVNKPREHFTNNNIEIDKLDFSENTKRQFEYVLEKHGDVFAKHKWDLGECDVVPHVIQLKPGAKPIQSLPRRVPYFLKDKLRDELNKMLEAGIIEKSNSCWASPLVICEKKDGEIRICIDLRRVNSQVYNETFPITNIEDILSNLNGMKYYSTIDIQSAFHQQTLDVSSRPITAFVCSEGHYQFCRTPFGLNRSPGSFCRMMKSVLEGLEGIYCFVYIDDIIIFSKDEKSHVEAIDKVLSRLVEHKLKLKMKKCTWFQRQISFVGYQISEKGIEMDEDRIRVIREWPRPTTVKEIRSFIGMLQYFRKFIKDFAKISTPLTNLTKKDVKWEWTDELEGAFQKLKDLMTKPPVLAHPDFKGEFILTTDASGFAIGGILSQIIGGIEKPIAFGSRQLNNAESKYSSHRQEALAMVYFVNKFRHFLKGRKFTLRTDCRALTYLMSTTSKQSAILARYIETLSGFDFNIQHHPGKLNKVADALSRYPTYEKCKDCYSETNSPVINSIELNDASWLSFISREEMELAQKSDGILSEVIKWIEKNDRGKFQSIPKQKNELRSYWNIFPRLRIKYGLLWYVLEEDSIYRLVVPKSMKFKVLEFMHDHITMGHRGVLNTLNRIRTKFYWVNLKHDCENWVKSCEQCVACKRSNQIPPLREPYRPKSPDEKICIDCIGPLDSSNGYKYGLCVIDDFSKFAQAFPMRGLTARETARVLVQDYMCKQSSIPKIILSDRGSNFTSELFKEVCNVLKIKGVTTLPYSPSSNGAIERWNNTLKTMIKTYMYKDKKWSDMLPFLSLAYNSTVHSATGFTPNFLHRGRESRLPVELLFPSIDNRKCVSKPEYAKNLRRNLEKAVQFANHNLKKTHDKYIKTRDKHVYFQSLKIGDTVLIKDPISLKFDTKGKIVEKFKNNPVLYKVEKSNGIKVTLHHNKLKKIFLRELMDDTYNCVKNVKKCKTVKPKVNVDIYDDYSESDFSDEENVVCYDNHERDINVPINDVIDENVLLDNSDNGSVNEQDLSEGLDFVPRRSERHRNTVQKYEDYQIYGDASKCAHFK